MPSQEEAASEGVPQDGAQDDVDVYECASPSSYLGLNNGSQSPRESTRSASESKQLDAVSPFLLGGRKQELSDLDLEQPQRPKKKRSTKGPASKRLSGRPAVLQSPEVTPIALQSNVEPQENSDMHHEHRKGHRHVEHLIDQVSEWIREERKKRSERKGKHPPTDGVVESREHDSQTDEADTADLRRGSDVSDTSFDLNKLESIIKHNLSFERRSKSTRNRSPTQSRRTSVAKLWHKQSSASSDDQSRNEAHVPSCNVALDNSKTLQHAGGASSDPESSSDDLHKTTSYKDRDAWQKFKFEIVRLTHTLRLKGWRKIPMRTSNQITVKRLSGALTNAVYVVSPPSDLPHRVRRENAAHGTHSGKAPPKLLLRIYGPQVGHLINREAELAILRRLAKQKIGPRMLGTFANGRFEEYFYANPLTPDDLRNPDTSRQIAKRMRELHDGVELLDSERDAGAFVWRNWDSWVDRVEKVVMWLDSQVAHLEPGTKPTGSEAWKRRGYICLVPWKQFRQMVEQYRTWLVAQCGGLNKVREQLVFAHNDTQYGNILRMMPSGDSPLLLPANTHKQLVVIDFEYANANVPGLEFANHFTEWCYNYHDERKPYAFNPDWYPKPEEQDRFVRAYVRHRPPFNVSTPKLAPYKADDATASQDELPLRRPTSSISDFMLDARAPPATPTLSAKQQEEESLRKAGEDREVGRLISEAQIWRLANTAMWVAWGLVQAKVPGMPDFDDTKAAQPRPSGDDDTAREELEERAEVYRHLAEQQQHSDEGVTNGSGQEEVDEEFDYLGYAQHRAMFFWADAIQMGFVKEDELPEEARAKVKTVPY